MSPEIPPSPPRHDEQPRIGQQHLAVGARRIGFCDRLAVARKKRFAFVFVERVEERPEAGAGEPVDDARDAVERETPAA